MVIRKFLLAVLALAAFAIAPPAAAAQSPPDEAVIAAEMVLVDRIDAALLVIGSPARSSGLAAGFPASCDFFVSADAGVRDTLEDPGRSVA